MKTVLVFALALTLAPGSAWSCSCRDESLAEQFAGARVVFEGELVSAAPSGECGEEVLTFIATRVWKGGKPGPFVIRNGGFGRRLDGSLTKVNETKCTSPCPILMKSKRNYVIFAMGEDLRLGYCTPHFEVPLSGDLKLRGVLDALVKKVIK